jgi:hypothetical protein
MLESMILEGPENITTAEYRAPFYCCHTALDTCCCENSGIL